jgi:agmatine deiminase
MIATKSTPTPAALGFAMPAEWEKHEATWLGWPHNPTDWPGKLDTIRWVYGEIVRKIFPGEILRILVSHKAEEKLARCYLILDHRRMLPRPKGPGAQSRPGAAGD